jgi:MFS family permease
VTLDSEVAPALPADGPLRPSRAPWIAPFRRPGYRGFSVAMAGAAFAWTMSTLAVSWVTLTVTSDPLAVGLIFATRFVALLLFGIPAGVLADRADRRRLIVLCYLTYVAVALVLAALSVMQGGTLTFWVLVAGSFLLGILDTVRLSSTNAYTVDIVGPMLATAGIALASLIALASGVVANVVGGVVLRDLGLAAAFVLMAISMGLSAVALSVGGRPEPRGRPAAEGDRGSLIAAMTLLRRDRLLALLTLAVVLVEVFGFSSMTLTPVFARDVFGGGPDAYGALTAMRSVGGVLGLFILVGLGVRLTTGPWLMAVGAGFGLALIGFALTPTFVVALLVMAAVGACAAACDSLSQSLMQRSATDAERGASMGIWTFALGFGPVGHVVVGAAAGRFGAVTAQLAFGALLVVLMTALAFNPRIRALR